MFHAALVIAVCLCVNPTSPDATDWTKDLDTTKDLLTVAFSSNRLATRCYEILDGLRLHAAPDGGDLPFPPLKDPDVTEDFGFWSLNAADSLDVLGWSDFAQGFP